MEVSRHGVFSSTASQQVGWVFHSLKMVWVLQHIIILPDRKLCHCVWRCLKAQFMVTWQKIKTHWISSGYDDFKEQFQPPEQQRLGSAAYNAVAVVPSLKQGQADHKKQLLKFWYRYSSVLFTASMFTVSMLESLQLSICESSDSAVISLYTLSESRLPVSLVSCLWAGSAGADTPPEICGPHSKRFRWCHRHLECNYANCAGPTCCSACPLLPASGLEWVNSSGQPSSIYIDVSSDRQMITSFQI